MTPNVYFYILVMALVTYLIRALPLVLIRKEIKSRFIRSFLYYVPFATLAAMTFPSKSLIVVAIGASCAVLIVETLAGIL